MAHASDPSFLVLHSLRLKGFAEADAVAGCTALPTDDVVERLGRLADDGLVLHREGRLSGWALTGAGRSRHGDLVAAELRECGCRDDVENAYRRFLAVNHDLLAACTDWQLRREGDTQVPNDHSDADHDRAVLGRLRTIDDAIQPVCSDLASAMARFGSYGPRLAEALSRVDKGELEWFTRPVIDSYHTVWFELHEDLLTTLGIERSGEADVSA